LLPVYIEIVDRILTSVVVRCTSTTVNWVDLCESTEGGVVVAGAHFVEAGGGVVVDAEAAEPAVGVGDGAGGALELAEWLVAVAGGDFP